LERSNTLIVTYPGEPVKVAVRSYVVDPAARLFQLNAGQLQLIVVRSRLATGPGAYRKRTSVTPAAPAPGRNAGMPSSRCCQGAPAIYSPALARGRVIADRCTPDQGCTDPRSWPPPGGATSAVPPAPAGRGRRDGRAGSPAAIGTTCRGGCWHPVTGAVPAAAPDAGTRARDDAGHCLRARAAWARHPRRRKGLPGPVSGATTVRWRPWGTTDNAVHW